MQAVAREREGHHRLWHAVSLLPVLLVSPLTRPVPGFDPRRTFIFSDFAYMGGEFYKNCVRIAKARTARTRAKAARVAASNAAPP